VEDPTRRWVKRVGGGGKGIEQCDGDGDSGGGGGGDDDDDSMEDDEDEDKVLEEDNGSGQEEEEEEDQQDPLQEDHVDVTNLLHLLNRSVTPPLPPHF
jgi:hypothetical protein